MMVEVSYAYSSHIGTRLYQQDSVGAGHGREGVVFGVLCDGMGGLADGELASQTAVRVFMQMAGNIDPTDDIHSFLVTAANILNGLIYDLPSQGGERGDARGGVRGGERGASGTTLAAVVIIPERLFWVSVGDSRVYIIRGSEIVSATRDHSYSLELSELVRRGKITAEEAASDSRKDALISFLGIGGKLDLIDANQYAFALEPGDIVLLCSDGLYRRLTDAEILEIVSRHEDDPEECARVLPLYAFDKAIGSQDNTSVVLIKLISDGPISDPVDIEQEIIHKGVT